MRVRLLIDTMSAKGRLNIFGGLNMDKDNA